MNKRIFTSVLVMLLFFISRMISAQTIIYVDVNVSGGSNDGSSWANAYSSLQAALSEAGSGNQIWVANGTYYPSIEIGGAGNRYKTFQMINGVAIYGGFAGVISEDEITDRVNYGVGEANETILSGDIGTVGVSTDNCYHVIYNSNGLGITTTTILNGFTISGGNANHGTDQMFFCGGGIFNFSNSPSIANCSFINNSAVAAGGGLFNYMSSPTISNCTFNSNSAQTGGGISNYVNSSSTITGCVFTDNSASYGGGLQNYSSSSTITDCTFNSNIASSNGGGIENEDSSPSITNCTFSSNIASSNGGGVENDSSSPTIVNCTFSGNTASTTCGGGIYNNNGSSPDVNECIFRRNSAGLYGGGIYNNINSSPIIINSLFNGNTANCGGGIENNNASSPTISNCTFGGNSVESSGGGIYNDASSAPIVKNTIFWGDYKIGDLSVSEIYGGTPANFTYCCIQNGSGTFAGAGNIFINPSFVDADGVDDNYGTSDDDFTLQNSSPCIGTATTTGAPAADILGNTRGNPPDMGAYENILNVPEIKIIYVKSDAAGNNTGINWDNAYISLQSALTEAEMYDQIWVAKGTYIPANEIGGTGERFRTFRMINYVKIYGGFAGNESNVNERSNYGTGQTNETIISGNVGLLNYKYDNCYHVIYNSGIDANAGLDGFTITAGCAYFPSSPNRSGAGMYNSNSSPTIRNCTFYDNYASDYGAGMFNENNSSPVVSNCKFIENFTDDGCAMANYNNSSPDVANCIFDSNSGNYGGGVYNDNSSPTLTNCLFTRNIAINGGGVYNDHSSPSFNSCLFESNNSSLGGGIHNYYSSSVTTGCTFSGNSSYEGAGIFNDNSSPNAVNCLFESNTATFGGGIFNLNLSNSIITNCTFSLNHSNDYGGGAQIDYSSAVTFRNCILWGNTADDGGNQIYANDGSCTIENSCFSNGAGDVVTNGTGSVTPSSCINSNPKFVDPGNNDFRITGESPCLDWGNNSSCSQSYDIRGSGHQRKLNKDTGTAGTIDMGAYEYEVSVDPLPVELISFTATKNNSTVTLNWQTATEVNNYGFSVERSQKSEDRSQNNWIEIGFVEGSGTSNSPKNYSFEDNSPLSSKIEYRLKQIDIDGSFSYSNVIEFTCGVLPSTFELFQNYPNPFNPTTVISWQLAAGSKTQIKIFDVLGREVATLVDENLTAGEYTKEWNASNLPSGIYFCRMETENFTHTIKMILLR